MFESDVSLESFLAFATDSLLNAVTIPAIIDANVEMVDGNGEVAFLAYLVTLKKADAVFDKGDILTKDDKDYQLQDVQSDDGFLVEISAL
mgnify:CR=1 FL=1